MIEQGLQALQHSRRAVGNLGDAIYEVTTGKMQVLFGYGCALVLKVESGLAAESLFDFGKFCHYWHL